MMWCFWSLRMIFLHGGPPVFLEQQGFHEVRHWLWLTSLTDEKSSEFWLSQNLQKSRKLTMSWIFGGTKLALEVGLILKRMCFGNSTRIFHCNNSFLKVNDLSFVIILCFSGNFFTTPLKTNITIAGKSTMNMDQMEIFQPVMSVFSGNFVAHWNFDPNTWRHGRMVAFAWIVISWTCRCTSHRAGVRAVVSGPLDAMGGFDFRPCLTIETVTIWISNLHVLGSYIGKKIWNSDELAWERKQTIYTLWIQVPPKKVLYPPNCTLSAFLAATWIHRAYIYIYIYAYRYNTLNTSILKKHLSHPPKHKLCEGANGLGHIFLRLFIEW